MKAGRPVRRRAILAPDVPVGLHALEVGDPEPDRYDADADVVEWHERAVTGSFSGTTGAHLDIAASRVVSVGFTGSHFAGFDATDVVFEGCEFSAASLDMAHCTRVEFRGCRLRAVSLGAAQLRDVRFVDCQLDEASLRMCRAERVGFEGSSMVGADCSGVRFSDVHLFDGDLSGAEFTQAQMAGTRLHGCTLDTLRGAEALRGVIVDSSQAIPLGLLLLGTAGVRVDDDRDVI